jgi:hypothetical protein
MDRPGCHAQTRRVVSVYLASLADAAPLPQCPGVSSHAMRSALLRMMCRIAQNNRIMRYGLRASKLAQLCGYSVATIYRGGALRRRARLPGLAAGAAPGIRRPGRQGC